MTRSNYVTTYRVVPWALTVSAPETLLRAHRSHTKSYDGKSPVVSQRPSRQKVMLSTLQDIACMLSICFATVDLAENLAAHELRCSSNVMIPAGAPEEGKHVTHNET